jgi:hypothetical protein
LSAVSGDISVRTFERRRWLFPSAVIHELDPDPGPAGRRPRRTARDWFVDFSCFLLAVLLGVAAANTMRQDPNVSATGSPSRNCAAWPTSC